MECKDKGQLRRKEKFKVVIQRPSWVKPGNHKMAAGTVGQEGKEAASI